MHWRSVEQLAQRRTRELQDAYLHQRAIEDKALKTEERLSALSRLGVVSQLSSIFAHEMGQPLSAIRYRTRALRSLFKNPAANGELIGESLDTIDRQSEKAARILQKVRDYAKGQTTRNTVIRLDWLLENTVADMKRAKRLPNPTRMHVEAVSVLGDELELGLALMNILKNAAEATADKADARVTVDLREKAGRAVLRIENDGHMLDQQTLAEHMTPMSSAKETGIGLGLVIISSIAEAHGGSFTLSPLETGGARAVLDIPCIRSETPNKKEDDA